MCGLFGFEGKALDLGALALVAELAARRGPHGCGIAWEEDSGRVSAIRWTVPWAKAQREAISQLTPKTRRVIGHCRLATSGDRLDAGSTHPIVCDEGALVHNGNVPDHRARASAAGIELVTECDSELLGRWVERGAGALSARVRAAAAQLGAEPFAVLALWPGELAVARHGLPLYEWRTPGGRYFCSVAPDKTATQIEEVPVATKTKVKPKASKAKAADPLRGVEVETRTSQLDHPISAVVWRKPSELHANDYNPNKVFKTELALLKTSIMADGWTQPIVVKPDGEIVDGFHRWTLGSTDKDVQRISGGLVPTVTVQSTDLLHLKMSTVRHNRARGQHGILKMGNIVRALQQGGMNDEEICEGMGMEQEEVDRLADMTGSPDSAGKDSFGKGWIPDPRTK